MQFMITAYDGKDSAAGGVEMLRDNMQGSRVFLGQKLSLKEDDVLWRENHLII